jgi:hypothetical protein
VSRAELAPTRAAAELARLELEAAALRRAVELLTACACEVDGGLDCPDCEPVPPLVRRALDASAGRAVAAELRAARVVVGLAREVGREDLDEVDVAERLADAIDAYDQAAATHISVASDPAAVGGEDR